jgi:pyridoxine 5-phosphate synthase
MRLCINIDHVATIREARGGLEPDPVTAAQLCELYGADGIVCHLREDRRHINDRDLRLLRETVKTKLDLEMAMNDEIIGICIDTLPELATLVPEKRMERTTESGLDVLESPERVRDTIKLLHDNDIEVSIFIDPVKEQIEAAAEAGADIIELHTGEYANSRSFEEQQRHLEALQSASLIAASLDLGIHAGHGLDYRNLGPICAIPEIEEVSIGHSFFARAVLVGIREAFVEMRDLIRCSSTATSQNGRF